MLNYYRQLFASAIEFSSLGRLWQEFILEAYSLWEEDLLNQACKQIENYEATNSNRINPISETFVGSRKWLNIQRTNVMEL